MEGGEGGGEGGGGIALHHHHLRRFRRDRRGGAAQHDGEAVAEALGRRRERDIGGKAEGGECLGGKGGLLPRRQQPHSGLARPQRRHQGRV